MLAKFFANEAYGYIYKIVLCNNNLRIILQSLQICLKV